MDRWKVQSEQELFRRRMFALKDLECLHPAKGVTHSFVTFSTPDWINVVAETEDGSFVMVRQHRLGTDEITIETPGGLVEPGEDPMETAKRELREETGYEPQEIVLLKALTVNPAIFSNRIFIYLARGCRRLHEQNLDSAEDIEVFTCAPHEIMRMIADGTINHSLIVMVFLIFFLSKWSGYNTEGNPLSQLR